ncbi:hypothetical protein S40285_10460 [Stachybotrys chlorohalonatus IBT 40285]|uniref:Uncharacterized protein n=1 Tax=Stachybotrys chlorohalonatus (strain IBT 40285) TaxID=1283841 RepID=A0A084QBC1_STAC4|nr:hypothetical protein S40285_10460 [Stachybotrys chlorohalonata IBT 40285]
MEQGRTTKPSAKEDKLPTQVRRRSTLKDFFLPRHKEKQPEPRGWIPVSKGDAAKPSSSSWEDSPPPKKHRGALFAGREAKCTKGSQRHDVGSEKNRWVMLEAEGEVPANEPRTSWRGVASAGAEYRSLEQRSSPSKEREKKHRKH